MKKMVFAIIFVLLVSLVAFPCLSTASEAEGLVTFDGYEARKYDYNGVRAMYTLDTDALKTLEETYNVTIGVLLDLNIAEADYQSEMTVNKAKVNSVFYSTKDGYKGKYYDKDKNDKKIEFVYTVTFEGDSATDANYQKGISARAYVKLASKNGGAESVIYTDNTSSVFGYSISMHETAQNFVATTDKNYPILQRLLDSTLKEIFINNITIDKYSVTGDEELATDVSDAIKEKFGYKLPVVGAPYFADSYIGVGVNNSLGQNVIYRITANNGVINIGFKDSSSASSAIDSFKDALDENNPAIDETIEEVRIPKYKVTYGEGANDYIEVEAGKSFTLPVVNKAGYSFIGYFTEADVQIADLEGNSLAELVLTSDITVVAKYKRIPTEADSATGQLLGNPLKAYYKNTSFIHKISRNPQDLIVYNGKVYLGGGNYDGGWNSAPPISVYDIASGTWGNVDFTVKMYEALDAGSTTTKWHELPATSSNSNNVYGGIKNIPVTTDCEISNFRFINGKPVALGADSIQGYTWADGTVSTSTTTTQKYVGNNLGNYYIVEEDENGNERWVEYRSNVLNGVHVYDVVEIDYNGEKTLMFAVGTSGTYMPAKILTNKDKKTYISPKFYLANGTVYDGTNNNNRIYNFFKTDAGLFAYYAHQGGKDKKIFKYNFTNNEHRFDEVRDITVGYGEDRDFRTFVQSDVDKNDKAITSRRLWTDFIRTDSFNGYAYVTTGNLYKTKTFEDIKSIKAPNSAIVTDLITRDGKLYALGFVKTNSSTNAYTNYIWSIDANDKFTQIRTFTSTGAYALSFDKDADFFYVGLGGPTTHITDDVANVGNILKLSINPVTE